MHGQIVCINDAHKQWPINNGDNVSIWVSFDHLVDEPGIK